MPRPATALPADAAGRPARVGLVLAAGGTVGIAWLFGALAALRRQTGWDPASADILAHHRLASLLGFLPRGHRSTGDIRGLSHEAVRDGWPSHTRLWVNACDYKTGRRITFGRPGALDAELKDAVAASCAVPGYYAPVRIGRRSYADGGLWSFTNADVLAGEGCDLVICLWPTSSRERGSVLDTAVCGLLRRSVGGRLAREAETLRAEGTSVVTLQPSAADLHAMGVTPMGISRSRHVVETAAASLAGRLAAGLDRLTPAVEPARRTARPLARAA